MEPDVQEKREDFFAATNGSPISTAVALSLQVCVAAATGTPRTQEFFFSLQADKIKQGIYTQLPNQNLNALKYLQKKQSTLGVTHNHTTRNTRILYRHHHGKAVNLQK